MAKICGVVSIAASERETEERLRSMVGVMKHDPRSPEEYLHFEGGGMALIVNSSFGEKRSACNEERGSRLALCGRVVGLKGDGSPPHEDHASRKGGAEWLLRTFEEHGEEILEKLNGEFAFAHYDPATRSLSVVNDRYGVMPLYYYCKDGTLLFASEVKAILRVLGPLEFDWESFADFFYINQMTGQKTLFKDVRALAPGQILTYRDSNLRERQYYDFTKTSVLRPEEVSTEKAASLFTEAVRRRIEQNKPNTVMLSGGFDSRLVLGALRALNVDSKTMTLGHARARGGMDGRFALLLADRLGIEPDFRPTREGFFLSQDCLETFYIQDGMWPSYETFNMEIYPELEGDLGLVWEGLALDVALGSSRQSVTGAHDNEKNLKQFAGGRGRQKGIPSRRYRRLLLRFILTPHYFRLVNQSFMRRLRDSLAQIPESENQFTHFILKYQVRRNALMPHQLFAAKVESVTPAVDADFMAYVLSIPQSLKHNYKFYVDMIKKHFPLLAKAPVSSGGYAFHFDSAELEKEEPTLLDDLKLRLTRALLFLKVSLTTRLSRGHAFKKLMLPSRLSRLPPEVVVQVLEYKNFDRPFYKKRLLRRLFRAYRNGVVVYHNLFGLVFYIELWHLLFVDEDSPALFNPKSFGLSELSKERKPS